MKSKGVTNEAIMGFLVEMDERVSRIDERVSNIDERVSNIDERLIDMNERMATKDDLERLKEEIIDPIIKAVDKDAETIFNHGKRITVLEREAGIVTK